MALPLIPLIITLLITIALLIHRQRRPHLPPGPRPWPIVGNLFQIQPVLCRCFADWAQTYGPIMSVWLGSTLNVVVTSSDLAKEVLKECDQQLADRPRTRSLARFSRDGTDLIWADYGPHYVKVRKVCTLELFTNGRLESLKPIREDEVTAMVESIFRECTASDKTESILSVRTHLSAVSLNNTTRLVFGKRFVDSKGILDAQGSEFKAIVYEGNDVKLSLAEFIRWLRWVTPSDEEAYEKHAARRDRLSIAIMEECTRSREKSGSVKQHFADALLTLKEKYSLSEDTIIGLLWDMITAGMDTTTITVEWALAELIRNPRVQEKAQEELDRVIGTDRVITESDFPNLPYLTCLVKEALRLHPPTPMMLPHKASTNVKIGGYDIPKGSNVQVNVWAIARDPKVWKEPLKFRPERFIEEDVDIKGHDFRLLPFGAGRRVCPGAQLGINLVQSMLGHLLHHFKWTVPEGAKAEEIELLEGPGLVTFMNTPLQAVATPRLPPHLYKRQATDM